MLSESECFFILNNLHLHLQFTIFGVLLSNDIIIIGHH